jgi:hypothetical protein
MSEGDLDIVFKDEDELVKIQRVSFDKASKE